MKRFDGLKLHSETMGLTANFKGEIVRGIA